MTDGQLSLFDQPPSRAKRSPITRPSHRPRKEPWRVTWLGPGHCRACNARLFVYRTTDGLRVWVQPNLVNACPSCGISMTTTTVALTTEDDPEAGS